MAKLKTISKGNSTEFRELNIYEDRIELFEEGKYLDTFPLKSSKNILKQQVDVIEFLEGTNEY